MSSAQDILLNTINGLIVENEIEKALEVLIQLDETTQAGIGQDIILQSAQFHEAEKSFQRGLISFDQYTQQKNRLRYNLTELMKQVPRRVKLNAQVRGLDSFQFEVPDEAHLEKIIGQKSNLLKINWLEKALVASKAVCRVVCADGSLGTGFLTAEGYIFTNNHVLPNAEAARTARIEFNYETDVNGAPRSRTSYQLDATDFISSPHTHLDFARVKVIDQSDNRLKQWGFVEFDPGAIPAVGDSVTIIQHPMGEDKQIALNANDVLSVWNQHVYYTTDTEPGSSGSPVFNKDWKVVAIHHYGKDEKDGGVQINARGDRRAANRGVLAGQILDFIKGNGGKIQASSGGNESTAFVETAPVAPPLADTPPPASPIETPKSSPTPPPPANPAKPTSGFVPPKTGGATVADPVRLVLLYDQADASACDQINKHLSVQKLTKKIAVYNVHQAPPGADVMEEAGSQIGLSDYVLCLISSNIANNDSIWLAYAISALEQGKRVIPVMLSPYDIEGTGLERLRSLPSQGRVVSAFGANIDAAYADIANEIKKLPK